MSDRSIGHQHETGIAIGETDPLTWPPPYVKTLCGSRCCGLPAGQTGFCGVCEAAMVEFFVGELQTLETAQIVPAAWFYGRMGGCISMEQAKLLKLVVLAEMKAVAKVLPFASGGVVADQKPVMVGEMASDFCVLREGETVSDFFLLREVAEGMEALANPGVALNVGMPPAVLDQLLSGARREGILRDVLLSDFGRDDVVDSPANRVRRQQLMSSLPGREHVGIAEEPLRPGADFHLRFAVATAALLVVLGLGALLMWH
jgi:hypothetical protein